MRILSQEHPLVDYYTLYYKCSVEDVYNMIEILDARDTVMSIPKDE